MADIDIDVVDGIGTDGYVVEARGLFRDAIRARSVSQMILAIIRRLGPNRLHRLRIFGHAAPGLQGVADSHTTWDPNRLIQVDAAGRLQNSTMLAMLAASFGPHGSVELHGCEVARGSMGKDLLTQLSVLWRVPVRGGLGFQIAPPGFEGATRVERPPAGIRTVYP